MTSHDARSGFAWKELVALLVCLGLFAALVAPALLGARESMRRTACTCHGKQIGLAIQNFADARLEICPSYLTDDQSPAAAPRDFAAWPILLLPYLEQQQLYAMADLRQPLSADVAQHATLRKTGVQTFYCYTRNRMLDLTRNQTCAVGDLACVSRADLGPDLAAAEPRTWDSAMLVSRAFNSSTEPAEIDGLLLKPGEFRSLLTFKDIIDGLSNTAFISEKAVRQDHQGGDAANFARTVDADQQDGTFYYGGVGLPNKPQDLQAPGAIAYWSRRLATDAGSGPILARHGRTDNPSNRFGGWHPGIALVLKGDGSVSTVNVAASNTVLQRLGCRNDRKTFDLP